MFYFSSSPPSSSSSSSSPSSPSIPPSSASSPDTSASPKSSKLKAAEESEQIFRYGNTFVNYTLVKSKRRKTCEVIVDKNRGIIVRVPFEKTKEEIEKILDDKIRWAITKQKEYGDEIKEISKPTFENNSTLPYLGKNYELQIVTRIDFENEKTVDSLSKEKITFTDGKFFAYLFKERKGDNNDDDDEGEALHKEKTRKLYNEWLYSEANKIFVDKVNQYSKLVDATPKRIIIKDLRNRWGSLTKNKSLHLNFNLIKASEDIIDYIIIHELCHLKIKGHSYHFWDYLKQFVPDYQQKIKWLERNSNRMV